MIVPLAILGALTGTALWRSRKNKPKVMSDKQRSIYEAALATLKEPEKFRQLADEYDKAGFRYEAGILRMRAAVRELPATIKSARKKIFKETLTSSDPEHVREVASAFAGEGCFGAARDLYAYADSLLTDIISEPVPEPDDEVLSTEEVDEESEPEGAPEGD
jgi:hypothetical protein